MRAKQYLCVFTTAGSTVNIRPVKAAVLSILAGGGGWSYFCLIIARRCCLVCGGLVSIGSWLHGYKTLFMLNTTEYEILTAGKQ